MKNTDKVTMTVGQLKRLVKENVSNKDDFVIKNGVLQLYQGNSRDIIIPDGVWKIGGGAFEGNPWITSVKIGSGVKIIEKVAFFECSALKSVTIGDGVRSIEMDAFGGCDHLTNVKIGNGVKSIEKGAFNYCPICHLDAPDYNRFMMALQSITEPPY